jgi:hypothetical protein
MPEVIPNDPRNDPKSPKYDPNFAATQSQDPRNDPMSPDFDPAYAKANPRVYPGSTLNNPQRSVLNQLKFDMRDQFTALSTEIGRLRAEGANVHDFDALQNRITSIRSSIEQFNP